MATPLSPTIRIRVPSNLRAGRGFHAEHLRTSAIMTENELNLGGSCSHICRMRDAWEGRLRAGSRRLRHALRHVTLTNGVRYPLRFFLAKCVASVHESLHESTCARTATDATHDAAPVTRIYA